MKGPESAFSGTHVTTQCQIKTTKPLILWRMELDLGGKCMSHGKNYYEDSDFRRKIENVCKTIYEDPTYSVLWGRAKCLRVYLKTTNKHT